MKTGSATTLTLVRGCWGAGPGKRAAVVLPPTLPVRAARRPPSLPPAHYPYPLLCPLCSPLCSVCADYFFDSGNVANGGNRWATVLMYLSDADEGGETGAAAVGRMPAWRPSPHPSTSPASLPSAPASPAPSCAVFPNVPKPAAQTRAAGYSECAMAGLAVRPRKGDAVLFFSLRTEGVLDRGSLHGSCPTLGSTQKWAATKW